MRFYENEPFKEILQQIIGKGQSVLEVSIPEKEFIFLQYYLTMHNYYAVIIDDYPFEIVDKESLLEALYYQLKLITMHDLNWDAFMEEFYDLAKTFLGLGFEGICLLFRNKELKTESIQEISTFEEIIEQMNKYYLKQKQIYILISKKN